MKKLLSIALVVLLALTAFGCATKEEVIPPPTVPPKQEQPVQAGDKGFKPSLGGIKLGDSREKVLQAFGTEYQESIFEEGFSLGEPFVRMTFKNGISVIVGSETKKVLEIETNSTATTTNLGYKVGDKAQDVLDKYRSYYQEPNSRHSDDKLIGWFLLQDEELIIFNFEKDEALVNDPKLKPDAKVQRIKLSNFKYMD